MAGSVLSKTISLTAASRSVYKICDAPTGVRVNFPSTGVHVALIVGWVPVSIN